MAKKITEKQKNGLAKGKKIQMRAMQIMKEGGTKTVPGRNVYRITLGQAMKKASAELNGRAKSTSKKVKTNKKRVLNRKK